ncbi:MAG: SBBP repeat-containing protein [Candidatus Kapabacteria bacterium]|nr:SBBP repeat-containing protein [Candidatus Kapabacteria bacterium]
MRFLRSLLISFVLIALVGTLHSQQRSHPFGIAATGAFIFAENVGQWPGDALFQGRADAASVRFRRGGVDFFYITDSVGNAGARNPHRAVSGYLLATNFVGARADVEVVGEWPTAAQFNYYGIANRNGSHSGANGFQRVRYRNIYHGIDALYYGNNGGMKYDFIIAPGANHRQISLRYDGADSLSIGAKGELQVHTPFGVVREAPPYCYQEVAGERVPVRGEYRLMGNNQFGFAIGSHRRDLPLVIDPCLSVEYVGYLGGGGYDVISSIAIDSSGNTYVTGFTNAPDFPLRPGIGALPAGNYIFVSKLTSDGSQLLYSTVVGRPYAGTYIVTGQGEIFYEAIGEDLEVTAAGEAVVGFTTNIPNLATTPGAWATTKLANDLDTECDPPIAQNFDFYVARLDRNGELKWGTYLGGKQNDYFADLALDNNQNVCITGTTYAPECGRGDTLLFPFTVDKSAFASNDQFAGFQAVAMRLSANGGTLQFSAPLGGRGNEFAGRIAVDQSGNIITLGSTNSDNFRTTPNAFQPAARAGIGGGVYDLYLAQLNPTAGALLYSTYIADNGAQGRSGLGFGGYTPRQIGPMLGYGDQARTQALSISNSDGTLLIGGTTRSRTLPASAGAFQGSAPNGANAFVIRFDIPTNRIIAATYVGGSDDDFLGGLGFDPFGDVAVAVSTASHDFPITNVNIQSQLYGVSDAALVILGRGLGGLSYGTFIGGSTPSGSTRDSYLWEQSVRGLITAPREGGIYLYGATSSRDLPVTFNAFQRNNDYYSGYIIKFAGPNNPRLGTGLAAYFPENACGSEEVISHLVFNSGFSPLTIDSATVLTGEHFRVLNTGRFPITLGPCDSTYITVAFKPAPDALCDRNLRDSLLIHSANALPNRTAVYLQGIKRCIGFTFLDTAVNDPRYWLGSTTQYHFRAAVQGDVPQYLTITPDPGNQGIFVPTPPVVNRPHLQGTAFVDFEIRAPDTGYYCETFTATIEPCGRSQKLKICAYVKSGFFHAEDTINLGVLECRTQEIPITIGNTGNDTLRWRLWFIGGDQGGDIIYDQLSLVASRPLPQKDSVSFNLTVRPTGVGKRQAILVFETNELRNQRPRIILLSELDTVSFRLGHQGFTGGFGELYSMPISYEPIRQGRVPSTELTFLAKFNPSMLAVEGIDGAGTMTEGWSIVEKQEIANVGTLLRISAGTTGKPLRGAGMLTRLKLKVLRGDSVQSPLRLELSGISSLCMNAQADTTQLFLLSEECRAHQRLLFTSNRLLKQSLPNPARGQTVIPFRVPHAGQVRLTIYDAIGREVLRLLDAPRPEGTEELIFDATLLPSGRYYYRITIDNALSDTREMVIE